MPLPPIATVAACGSVITAIKSSWELSRMLKRKEEMKRVESRGRAVLKDLRDAYEHGYMNRKSFDKWYDKWLGAMAEKDLLELRKINEHVKLIGLDNKDHKSSLSRRSTYPPSSSVYGDEKHSHRGRARSSSRVPPPVYTVEEYEEEKRRPSHIDTRKAQSDYWHSHALPTSRSDQYQLEYTPETDSFDEEAHKERHSRHRRRRHHRDDRDRDHDREGSHRTSSRSHSSSNTTERGRTRSRSVHTEQRVIEVTDDDDADSESDEYYRSRRRQDEYQPSSQRDGGRGHREGRGR